MTLPRFRIDEDFLAGFRSWRIWSAWAAADIKQSYRRSVIGPFWQTITLAIMISGLSAVFSILWGMALHELMPYLCAGIILWTLLTGMVNEGCHVFIANAGAIKSINLPISVYVFRLVHRHFVIFGHNVIVFLLVMLIFRVPVTAATLMAVPGLLLFFANGVWVGMFLGLLSARFRDIPLIVQNVLQLAFFITPIFWKPEALGDKRFIANWNPFLHYIDIVRLPMMGQKPLLVSWEVALAVTAAGYALALWFFARYRRRGVGWL